MIGAHAGDRVLTEGEAYEVTRLLEGVITQGTGAGYTYMGCTDAAGKTGTSEDLSDAWFAGYTPLYSTAVWVGHPQSREATGFGGPTAGPIWRSFMESAVAGDCPEFEQPSSLPELSGLDSEHTSSGSYAPAEEGEFEAQRTGHRGGFHSAHDADGIRYRCGGERCRGSRFARCRCPREAILGGRSAHGA